MGREKCVRTWDPELGGRRALVVFEDDQTYDIGLDSESRFDEICKRILSGNYYPPDAIVVDGDFQSKRRLIKEGDLLTQAAPLFGSLGGPRLRSLVEIFVAKQSQATQTYAEQLNSGRKQMERFCHFGYVTTNCHHGRGIWQARVEAKDGRLQLRVWSTSMPNSFWFWLGLPIARFLQLRAKRRAIEEFRKI
jgi:hypothetical protein